MKYVLMFFFVIIANLTLYASYFSLQGTFHRRALPAPAISFASEGGKCLFKEALGEGNMEAYFTLAEHFTTQGKI
ncbi:hypothetical protein EON64_01285 [archaeon]|nr:MAG: hypothetical protein EON64_01285 [archaeon]